MFGTVVASVLARVTLGAPSSLAASGVLAADGGRLATLGRLFLIAVLFLIPYGIWLYRRDHRRVHRRNRPADPDGLTDGDANGSADSAEADAAAGASVDAGDLRVHLDRIEQYAAGGAVPDGGLTIELIDGCRLDGAPVATVIAIALVTDTARQCGLVVSRAADGDASQVFVLARPDR